MKLRPESDQADVQAFVQQLILIGTHSHKPLNCMNGKPQGAFRPGKSSGSWYSMFR